MKIIILGAGQVGRTLAEHLLLEHHDVTLIDIDESKLAHVSEKFDMRTIVGNAAHPEVLHSGGAQDADMLIALTGSDETNMLACQIAYTLFRTPTKIARVRAAEYMHHSELFNNKAIPVDVLISPEQLVTNYVKRLIQYPGALQVLDFAEGHIQLVTVKALADAPLIGQSLSQLHVHLPSVDARVVAIFRHGQAITPDAHTEIAVNDEVFFIAAKENVREVISELRGGDAPYRNIVIAGGGNIGLGLAQSLEKHYHVKIINRGKPRCRILAEKLNNTVVLTGNAVDEDLLFNENIKDTDVFCAVTNDDEVNIMSATLAKRMGARKVMALINRQVYVDLIEGGEIDIVISPQLTTLGNMLSHIRRGDMVQVHSLRRGAAEALEAVAHGSAENSKVVGHSVADIKLPKGALIGAIVRDKKVIMAQHDTKILADDHVILFVSDKKHVAQVERLFQVGLTFF